jgi:PA14 domain
VKRWIRTHRTELWLFLLLWGTYAYFYQSTYHNEAARFDQLRAIVQDHTLEINKYWWNSADIIHYSRGASDHIYPNKAPGMTLLAIIPFGILSLCLRMLRTVGLPEWIYWHLLTYLTTILTVSLLSALAAVGSYRVLKRITANSYFSMWAVLAIWLGTLAFPFSTLFFSHQLAASLLTIAFYFVFKLGRAEITWASRQFASAGGAGLLMGLSVATEYPTVLLVGLLSAYAIWAIYRSDLPPKRRTILLGTLVLGGLIGGAVLISYNILAFHKPFYIPYEAYSTAGSYFSSTYSLGWLGLHWPEWNNFLHALASITILPQIGMLYIGAQGWRVYACNPVLWLSLPGLAVMIWKRQLRAEGVLIGAMAVTYIFFITSYGTSIYDWSGASYLGSRHIIPLLPFLALPLYFGARLLWFAFYPLLAVSVFYMLLATAIEPRVPFPYENPARDFLFPDYLRARWAQNTSSLFDGQQNLTEDSTAFNLGKIARFPGPYQLTPLMMWWLIAGGAVIIAAQRDGSMGQEQVLAGIKFTRKNASPLLFLFLFVTAISLPPIVRYTVVSSRHPTKGLLAKYYRNANWTGSPADVEIDREVDFDWSKSMPLPPPFSIEWTGSIAIDQTGAYTFGLIADDGALLEIDGKAVVDVTHILLQKRTGEIYLSTGMHPIRVRYFNLLFGGSVRLSWTVTGRPEQIVPAEVLVPPAPSPSPRP